MVPGNKFTHLLTLMVRSMVDLPNLSHDVNLLRYKRDFSLSLSRALMFVPVKAILFWRKYNKEMR